MDEFHKNYDLKPMINYPNLILPIENEFSFGKKLSNQKDVVQNFSPLEVTNTKKIDNQNDIFAHQHEVYIYVFQDIFTNLLQSSRKDNFVAFLEEVSGNVSKLMNLGDGFNFNGDLSLFRFFFLLGEVEYMLQSRIQLLDWLH